MYQYRVMVCDVPRTLNTWPERRRFSGILTSSITFSIQSQLGKTSKLRQMGGELSLTDISMLFNPS